MKRSKQHGRRFVRRLATSARTAPTRAVRLHSQLLAVIAILAFMVATVSLSSSQPAAADPIADKRAQAARVADKSDQLAEQLESLGEDLAAGEERAKELANKVAQAEADLQTFAESTKRLEEQAKALAIASYVKGLGGEEFSSGSLADFNDLSNAQVYGQTIGSQDADSLDELRAARLATDESKLALAVAKENADKAATEVKKKFEQLEKVKADQDQLLAELQGELASLVRAEHNRRAAEQEIRVRAQVAARQARQTASASASAAAKVPSISGRAGAVIAEARKHLGKPYVFGSAGPNTFDCSGLTSWAWRYGGGVSLPHSSRAQYAMLPRVAIGAIQPGDLIFFGSPIHHVGLYIGNGQMINAPRTGYPVRVDSIYRSNLVGAARVG